MRVDLSVAAGALDRLDALNVWAGRLALYLVLAMTITQIGIVLALFVFSEGSLWMQESMLYMHATYVALLFGYALLHDAHVRIDIFYRDAPPRQKAWVNLLGAALFLLPFCALMFFTALPYVAFSWRIAEGSPEASGIQAVYLLKSLIPLAAALLGLQGISMALRAALALLASNEKADASDALKLDTPKKEG